MAYLLTKLRVPYSSLIMLQGVTDTPEEATIKMHSQLLDGFLEGQNKDCFVSETEVEELEEKTFRQLKLREMLKEHSSNASLIVMSLPMPRQVKNNNFDNFDNITFLQQIFLGLHIGSIVHVLVGSSHKRYASIYASQRKSTISTYFLFVEHQEIINSLQNYFAEE